MKIKVTQNQANFIKNYTIINTKEKETYYYIPFWFKLIDEKKNIFEELNFDNLPDDLKDYIKNTRI